MQLYDYQKKAVEAVLHNKHLVKASCGAGKTLCSLFWAKATGMTKVLVVTQASVRDSFGFEKDAEAWLPDWLHSLAKFEVVSWQGLAKWTTAHWVEIPDYAVIFDEVQRGKAGVSSIMGKAFLQITKQTDCWTGWTATPGDKWEDYYAYFTACGYTRNKTDFYNRFCIMQRYPFPAVIGHLNEEEYMRIQSEIWHEVDASEMEEQLPEMVHQTIKFKQPTGYKQVMKTHTTLEGEFLDNASAACHYLRQLCGSKQKLDWLADFIDGLGKSCVIFYSYTSERHAIEQALKNKVRKIWHINGSEHDVPTAETIEDSDVVLAQWQAGAFGLNLQFINYWVSFSPNYSWTISTQARKRIHRQGQTRTTFFYYLVCEDTIDEAVYRALKSKNDFDSELWSKENGFGKSVENF